ncbi:agmatinase [Pseudoroseicyclus sp. H15]
MDSRFNQPLGGNDMPRPGGPATFMRLPSASGPEGLDAAILGIPMDIGTSNRPGTRLGPRAIRDESRMLRPYNMATGAAPFDHCQIADIGDVPINLFNLEASVEIIRQSIAHVAASGAVPVTLGGDHTLTFPALQGVAESYGPVALVHVDAHVDVNEAMFGEALAHGTPFRRAHEAGCLDDNRVIQIGLRGTGYGPDDFDWGRDLGWQIVTAEECAGRDLTGLMAQVADLVGDAPLYLSFDIDSLAPGLAPGTGTAEAGGLADWQALQIIRGLAGCNLVGCDLVEVSPPFDTSGNTAMVAAALVYEMLCILPGVPQRPSPRRHDFDF